MSLPRYMHSVLPSEYGADKRLDTTHRIFCDGGDGVLLLSSKKFHQYQALGLLPPEALLVNHVFVGDVFPFLVPIDWRMPVEKWKEFYNDEQGRT